MTLSEIFIYPVKGLGGIAMNEAFIDTTGLAGDRRWMLVDEHNVFLSQRILPQMALFKTACCEEGFQIISPSGNDVLLIPQLSVGNTLRVELFKEPCDAVGYSSFADAWFSGLLGVRCRLVYMPQSSMRLVEPAYNTGADVVSFADGFPMLMIGQASLDDLNARVKDPLCMDRFRPNLVFKGGLPFDEDAYNRFSIGAQQFTAPKACARCTVTTVNQQTAVMGKEPLKTLAAYRQKNNKIYFGQNVLHAGGTGAIRVGDEIIVHSRKRGVME